MLLGRYCIYLTTHVAGEVIAGKTLMQELPLPRLAARLPCSDAPRAAFLMEVGITSAGVRRITKHVLIQKYRQPRYGSS